MKSVGLPATIAFAVAASFMLPEACLAQSGKTPRYLPTGKTVDCLDAPAIEEAKVIDDQTVLFRTAHGYYLNHLPRRCVGLKFENGFSYTLQALNKLCHGDSITPIEGGGSIYGPCPLGAFDAVTKAVK
ncbi:MAG: hypothetical protein GC201_13435 [Alphaproteobacteria bacterium]|nr:hypothetical protein [Alphaproteobacteria bacterium]